MQIVIDIPKDAYDYVMGSGYFPSNFNMIYEIRNGVPLPKGHGKLKDFDKIEWYGCTTELNCPYKDRECKDCYRAECSKTQVDDIPTIIPADMEIKEKMKEENPYIVETIMIQKKKYNPNYGDNRMCICGHRYYRHFDSWNNMEAVGCKYCGCEEFTEADKEQ